MTAQIVSDIENTITITDCVDFLAYMKYILDEPYSLQGRTATSLSRSIHAWHGRIYEEHYGRWMDSKWMPQANELDLHFAVGKDEFSCKQLLSAKELDQEGKTMQHCVMTYAPYCIDGTCSIWSLHKKANKRLLPILTLEVIDKQVVQAQRRLNELPNMTELSFLKDWAERMNFTLNLHKNE
jgi:hypothetical protein